jgi:phage protein D
MDPIQEAIEDIESREDSASFSYREVASKFNINRTTLSRRHQGSTRSNAAMAEAQQLLNPQQELELVSYIEKCTRRGLPPTREMLQNFGSAVAQCEVSQSWVTRFLHRHSDKLTTKMSAGIDRDWHKADDGGNSHLIIAVLFLFGIRRSKRILSFPGGIQGWQYGMRFTT